MCRTMKSTMMFCSMYAAIITVSERAVADTATDTVDLLAEQLEAPPNFLPDFTFFSYDVEQEFASIDSITIEIAGGGTAGEADVGIGGQVRNFGPDLRVSLLAFSDTITSFSGPESVVFSGPADFSGLLSGAGKVNLDLLGPDFGFNDIFFPATMSLGSATVTIDGTFVPEPGALGLLALSALLAFRRR